MKTIFFGTPEFAVPSLKKLNEISDISLVVTQQDSKRGRGKKLLYTPIKEAALDLGLEVFQPEDVNSIDSLEKLKAQSADIYVVVAYGQILNKKLLNLPNKEIINVHASILPKYRGAAPIQASILNGDKESGVSIMRVEEGLDSGPIALIKKTSIDKKNSDELSEELSQLGAIALEEFFEKYAKNLIEFTPQDDSKSSYAGKIHKSMGKLNVYQEDAQSLVQRIRAMSSKPGAFFLFKGDRYKVFKAEVVPSKNRDIGSIIEDKNKLFIETKDDALEIQKIQRPGKKKMDTASFLAGFNFDEDAKVDIN